MNILLQIDWHELSASVISGYSSSLQQFSWWHILILSYCGIHSSWNQHKRHYWYHTSEFVASMINGMLVVLVDFHVVLYSMWKRLWTVLLEAFPVLCWRSKRSATQLNLQWNISCALLCWLCCVEGTREVQHSWIFSGTSRAQVSFTALQLLTTVWDEMLVDWLSLLSTHCCDFSTTSSQATTLIALVIPNKPHTAKPRLPVLHFCPW